MWRISITFALPDLSNVRTMSVLTLMSQNMRTYGKRALPRIDCLLSLQGFNLNNVLHLDLSTQAKAYPLAGTG